MNYIVKTGIVGDYGVGKTSIISRYVKDRFKENEETTLGVDFFSKEVNFKENTYKMQLWDTAGQEKFESIVTSYIRDLDVCILVFDVTSRTSFLRVRHWLDKIREIILRDIYICLIGNKVDLNYREVNEKEIEAFCSENNLDYLECSAKDSKNINTIFVNLLQKVDDKVKLNQITLRTYAFFEEKIPKKQKCCLIS